MRKLFIAIAILALVASAFAAFGAPQNEKEIQSIRQTYAAINRNQARYRKVKKELSGFSAEGGVLTAYFDGPNIVKILATYYGEMGRTNEEFYYRDSKLIFVLRTELNYKRPLSGKVVSTKLNRFYFHDDKLIRWIDESGKLMASDSSEFQEQEKDSLDTSKKFIDGARSKYPTIESDQ
jgi:opacity protein-like surface antigen